MQAMLYHDHERISAMEKLIWRGEKQTDLEKIEGKQERETESKREDRKGETGRNINKMKGWIEEYFKKQNTFWVLID